MLPLEKISASRIKTYKICKFKYFLTYHTPDVEMKSIWGAVHGTLLHDILENYSTNPNMDWKQRLNDGYAGELLTKNREGSLCTMDSPLLCAKAKEFNDIEPDCDECEYNDNNVRCGISHEPLDKLTGCPKILYNKSVNMLTEVIHRYQNIWPKILKNLDGLPIGTEYWFEIPIDGTDVKAVGIADLIIEEDKDTLHIYDYKAGVSTQNFEECRNDIQVRLYSLAARREFIDDINNRGFKYKNILLTFDYFQKSPVMVAFTEEEDLETEREICSIIKEIQSTELITRIVPNNKSFESRTQRGGYKYWQCRYLCDHNLCTKKWNGEFEPKCNLGDK